MPAEHEIRADYNRETIVIYQAYPSAIADGNPVERRAIQFGLRGDVLARYAREWLIEIQDLSEFVTEQRANVTAPHDRLVIPREVVYPVADPDVASKLGVSGFGRDD